jgi:hypothetical protein
VVREKNKKKDRSDILKSLMVALHVDGLWRSTLLKAQAQTGITVSFAANVMI